MAKDESNLIDDYLTAFPKGVNSGVDPFVIPKDQLSFAVNATVRGDFVTNRPPFNLLTLAFADPTIQSAATKALFQGACYYAPDTGQQMLVAQIGGRLFTFTPDISDNNVPVAEVSIAGDYNPANIPVAWLKQAERWVLVNNGVNNVIAFDGQTTRRLNPNTVLLGTTLGGNGTDSFGTPAIGATVAATLTAPFTGQLNQVVQLVEYDLQTPPNAVAASLYFLLQNAAGATTYNLTIQNLSDVYGTAHNNGATLTVQPNNLGLFTTTSQTSSGFVPNTTYIRTGTLSAPLPSYVIVGSQVSIAGDAGNYVWNMASISSDRKTVTLNFPSSLSGITTLSTAQAITLLNSGLTNQTVAVLSAGFSAPEIGTQIPVTTQSSYTYGNGATVFIDSGQYLVTSSQVVPGTSATVVLENLDDGRTSHTFNATGFGATALFSLPELPPGRMLNYGMGRVWESLPNGISFVAGDIVNGSSGSPAYSGRDAILKMVENTFLKGGGSFSVPSNLGLISFMKFTSQLDASLGQGALMVGTPGGVFSVNTPTDRSTWQSLTNPILSESLIGFGGVSQNSAFVANGDLLMRSPDGIRSLLMARRDFWSWGNAPISFEVDRIVRADSQPFLPYVSAAQFDNRGLMTSGPTQGGLGAYSTGIIALNFDPVSSLAGKEASVYDGLWTGLNILQLIEGQFNGTHRCFAFTLSSDFTKIQLVEILKIGHLDNGANPITWQFETPAVLNGSKQKGIFDISQIEDGEIYISDVQPGETVDIKVEYQPDMSSVWYPWIEISYTNKTQIDIQGCPLGLGKPPSSNFEKSNSTNASSGRWFQLKITIRGHCIFFGAKFTGSLQPKSQYAKVLSTKPKTPLIAPSNL